MATLNYEDLKNKANQIKNETKAGGNTAERLGSLLLEIIEKMEETRHRFDEYIKKQEKDNEKKKLKERMDKW